MDQATNKLHVTARPVVWTAKNVRFGWAMVIGWLAVLYIALNWLTPKIGIAELQIYLAEPVLWLSMAGLVLWLWRQDPAAEGLAANKPLIGLAVMFGVFQVMALLLAGLFFGFGNSPYARRFLYLLLNLWFVGTKLAGLEMARWYLVKKLGARSMFVGIFVAWLVALIILIPAGAAGQFGNIKSAFQYSGRVIMPLASEGLLATYLALVGGPFAAMGYRGLLLLFEWGSPILPDLEWIMTAFIGTIVPALGIMLVYGFYMTDDTIRAEEEAEDKEKTSLVGWILLALLAVVLFWFNTGMFGVQPTLVSGYSMKPTFVAGDVVVTRDVPAETIQVNDIIRFKQHGVFVLHRVIDIRDDENGNTVFITLGDNNRDPDPPVDPETLAGKVIIIVPKIGWVSIWMRELIPALGAVQK